MSTLGYHV